MSKDTRIAALRALCRRIHTNDRPLPVRAVRPRVAEQAISAGLVAVVHTWLDGELSRAFVVSEAGYERAQALTAGEVRAALELPAVLGMVG